MPPSTERALLTLRTVRHLRPGQIAHRLRYRLRPRPRVRTSPAPPRRALATGVAPLEKPSRIAPGPVFTFLGLARDYTGGVRWRDPRAEKLWLYNLHYFDYVAEAAALSGAASADVLVRDWIAANPYAEGDGWEPYPTSLRMVNWIKWLSSSAGAEDRAATLDSLALQARWLERNLERHILANHLFANAKAIAFAGLFFGGEEGERWLERGVALVDAELDEQILSDGGHYERSPMYHATLLEDVLDLISFADCANAGADGGAGGATDDGRRARTAPLVDPATLVRWRDAARRMLDWLGAMCHPDGEIAFFNDAAFGIAPTRAALAGYAERLGLDVPPPPRHSCHLAASGYARLLAGDATLLVDAAPVGPDHQPGHAHADTLSFELSLGAERVVVNSGTSTYLPSAERHRQRATPAHNTVTVDGADSSEVWAGFRVARRAYPVDVACTIGMDRASLSAAHDGYRRLPGRVVHRRAFALDATSLTIVDTLSGRWREAFAALHFHPRLDVHADGRVTDGDALVCRWSARGGTGRIEASTWHPRFGASEPNRRLIVAFAGDELALTLRFDGR